MTIFWPALIVGSLIVIAGTALWRHPVAAAKANADLQGPTFGSLTSRTQEASTPRTMGGVALGWIAIGTAMIVASMLGLDW